MLEWEYVLIIMSKELLVVCEMIEQDMIITRSHKLIIPYDGSNLHFQ